MNWETAFFKQYHDAATGRLVRGIVHNLNGVNQAFSLQATLFNSMFVQAEKLIDSIQSGIDTVNSLQQLKKLMRNRSVMAGQMEEKVAVSHNIVKRIQSIWEMYQPQGFSGISITEILDIETNFLNAESFFKHKVETQVELAADLPLFLKNPYVVHLIINILFGNSVEALHENVNPCIIFKAFCSGDNIVFEVNDNGCGIDPEVIDTVFEPFVTTNDEHCGVGLYILSQHVSTAGGSIELHSDTEATSFKITLPLTGL